MSEWYRRAFPATRIDPSKNTETEVMTTRRGSRFATSVGGTLTGRGGSLIVIDDPLKPADGMSEVKRTNAQQWFDNTVYSRLDDKQEDAIVLVMQRVHIDDLAGHLLRKGGWTHLNLPAIADADQKIAIGPGLFRFRSVDDLLHPEREPRSILDDLKKTMGSYDFSAQYLQQPVPAGGTLIRWGWFRFFQEPPYRDPDRHHRIVMSWDTASKPSELANKSVGQTWQLTPNRYYLLRQVRATLEYPDLRRLIIKEAEEQGANEILIEDKGSGTGLIQELKRHRFESCYPSIIAITPKDDKVMRMHAQTAKLEGQQVYLPQNAPWLDDFKNEVCAFPNGSYDDQVDAMSQFLNWVDQRSRRFVSTGNF